MMKKLLVLLFSLILFLAVCIMMIAQSVFVANHDIEASFQTLTDQTEQYRTYVETRMDELGFPDYANVVMTLIQMESSGVGTDIMGASHSRYNTLYPADFGGILDPYYSIECGMKDVIDLLSAAGIDSSEDIEGITIVLQTYALKDKESGSRHFEIGYIDYAQEEGGYTPEGVDDYFIPDDWDEEEDGVFPIWWDRNYGKECIFFYRALIQKGGFFMYPVSIWNLSCDYGSRYIKNFYGEYVLDFHTGIDLAAPGGETIVASNSGRVITASYDPDGYGNYLVIKHGARYTTLYGHCQELLVSVGDDVQQGDAIALVGSTGWSSGNHVHFEIRLDGQHIDPLPMLENQTSVD